MPRFCLPRTDWRPWRSARSGWAVAAAALAVGLPLYLRMPLWCDITLYDVAARTVLAGGVHYRDVFDTNLPGFVWALAAVRWAFGTSMEAVRVADLAVLVGVTGLLMKLARAGGATPAGVAWMAAAVAAFYPFLTEFCHAQRDVWMMLPALAAVGVRLRRVERAQAEPVGDGFIFRSAFTEGALWGLAFWVKPHVAVPAAAAWLVTARRLAGNAGRPWRRAATDLAGTVSGGAAVGAAGVAWLVRTGTWPHLLDVFRNWNTSYLSGVFARIGLRAGLELLYFPQWSLCLVFAVPVAVLAVIDGRVWSRGGAGCGPLARLPAWLMDRDADDTRRFARAVLAAVFIGWAGTALLFQRPYHYVHVPEVLLMLAVFAATRWAVPFLVLAWQAAVSVSLLAGWEEPAACPQGRLEYATEWRLAVAAHPAFDPPRTRWWGACFRAPTRELRNGVAFQWDFHAGVDAVQLGAVEDFLRGEGVRPGELVCWHDSPHALYLAFGHVPPPLRFMHVGTASCLGDWHYEQVRAEARRAAAGARFAVSDLYRVLRQEDGGLLDLAPDGLPWHLPDWQAVQFPFTEPVAFRSPSGRYLVHRIENPVGECRIPHRIGADTPDE